MVLPCIYVFSRSCKYVGKPEAFVAAVLIQARCDNASDNNLAPRHSRRAFLKIALQIVR